MYQISTQSSSMYSPWGSNSTSTWQSGKPDQDCSGYVFDHVRAFGGGYWPFCYQIELLKPGSPKCRRTKQDPNETRTDGNYDDNNHSVELIVLDSCKPITSQTNLLMVSSLITAFWLWITHKSWTAALLFTTLWCCSRHSELEPAGRFYLRKKRGKMKKESVWKCWNNLQCTN